MAAPDRPTLLTRLADACRIAEQVRIWGEVGSPSAGVAFINMQKTLRENAAGDYSEAATSAVRDQRVLLAQIYDGTRDTIAAVLADFGAYLEADPADLGDVMDALYADFVDNSDTVESRAFSRGEPTFSGATGTGVIRRKSVDENGYAFEWGWSSDSYTARCEGDVNTGADRHSEVFRIESNAPAIDSIETLGENLAEELTCVDPRSEDALLLNPSFDLYDGDSLTAPTEINDWESSAGVSGGVLQLQSGSSACFLQARDDQDDVRCLSVLADLVLSQKLSRNNIELEHGVPYYEAIAYDTTRASGACTLHLRIGAVSTSVAIPANTGWGVLEITGAYYKAIAQDDPEVQIEVVGLSGEIDLDDVWLAPMTLIGSTYYIARAGRTSFRAGTKQSGTGDLATWSDSAGESVIQRHISRTTGRYLPHDSAGGATVIDPL